jgi:hypothetical protein
VNADAEFLEPLPRALGEVVVAEGREQIRLTGEPRELHRGDAATARRLLEAVGAVDDFARGRQAVNPQELHPLDVPDNGAAHFGSA